jgi:hypothetical protein
MNAQSTHPINDTTDPLFLGPEAGQQAAVKAGGKGQGASDLDANGLELHRYFSVARGALVSVRSNGVTLCRQVDDEWRVLSRKKAECPLAQWVANKKASLGSLHRWQLEVDELPSLRQLTAWNEDGICATPTGPPRGARWHRARWRAFLASCAAFDLTRRAAVSTAMSDAPCPAFGRRFVVEASNSEPATRHGHERDNLVDCEICATRKAANQRARFFLRRGHWVEVYDRDTKELLAGPFDPDRAAPAYIV